MRFYFSVIPKTVVVPLFDEVRQLTSSLVHLPFVPLSEEELNAAH